MNNARKFIDNETNEIITIEELKAEYKELKANNETEAENFTDYLQNCTDKNGTLREIKNLMVCKHCLSAIESHEGKQATYTHYIDEENETISMCEWCEENGFNTLYELI